MTTFLCILFWLTVPVVVLAVVLGRLTESRRERIRRLRREGLSQQRIADQLGITRYQVRQALA